MNLGNFLPCFPSAPLLKPSGEGSFTFHPLARCSGACVRLGSVEYPGTPGVGLRLPVWPPSGFPNSPSTPWLPPLQATCCSAPSSPDGLPWSWAEPGEERQVRSSSVSLPPTCKHICSHRFLPPSLLPLPLLRKQWSWTLLRPTTPFYSQSVGFWCGDKQPAILVPTVTAFTALSRSWAR